MSSNKKAPSGILKDNVIKALTKKRERVVHSTFRLSREAHDAIKQIADLLEIKNAELFDRLLSLSEYSEKTEAQTSLARTGDETGKTRKTYVVKKETLDKLKKITDEKGVSRDLTIERCALAFNNIFESARSSLKEKYQAILEKTIKPFWSRAEDIERELSKEVGSDDAVSRRFGFIVILTMNLSEAIEGYLKNGTPIDPDDFSQS